MNSSRPRGRGTHRLGQVVHPREFIRRNLEVNLETGVTRLKHDRVVGHLQFINALDTHIEVATA